MASRARTLTGHEEIRRWAEDRGATPSCVIGTGGGDDTGMIRLDFPGYSGEGSLQEVTWDDWFKKFDESGLALLVQDTTAGGEKSNFNKLVSRANGGGEHRGGRRRASQGRRRAGTRGSSQRKSATRSRSNRGKRKATSRSRSAGARKSSSSRSRKKSQSRSRRLSSSSARKAAKSRSNRSSRAKSSKKQSRKGTRRVTLTIPKDVRIEAKGSRGRGKRAA